MCERHVAAAAGPQPLDPAVCTQLLQSRDPSAHTAQMMEVVGHPPPESPPGGGGCRTRHPVTVGGCWKPPHGLVRGLPCAGAGCPRRVARGASRPPPLCPLPLLRMTHTCHLFFPPLSAQPSCPRRVALFSHALASALSVSRSGLRFPLSPHLLPRGFGRVSWGRLLHPPAVDRGPAGAPVAARRSPPPPSFWAFPGGPRHGQPDARRCGGRDGHR